MENVPKIMEPSKEAKMKSMWISTRFTVVYTLFFGAIIYMMIMSGLNIVIIAMVNTEQKLDPGSHCLTPPSSFSPNSPEKIQNKPFDWNPTEVGRVLGAFYYGYSSSHLLGGLLANKFGGKWVYGLGILGSSICTCSLPLVAHIHVYCFFVVQVLSGICQGVLIPSLYSMIGKWAPMFERSIFCTLTLSGQQIGLVIAQSLAGYLCDLELFGGWPLAFYVFGLLGIFWFVIFCFTVYSYPEEHPRISQEELEFIKQTAAPSKSASIPWTKIIRSIPFWGFGVGVIGSVFIINSIMICIPQYLNNVHTLKIKENGFINSLSFMCCFVLMIVNSFCMDKIREKRIVSTTTIRKLNQFLATFLPAFSIIMIGYSGCNKTMAIAGLLLCNTCFGFSYSAAYSNAVDIAPAFAGPVISVSHTVASFSGFIAPAIMMWTIGDDPYSFDAWKQLFFIFAGIYTFTAVIFIIFGTGITQDWANVSNELIERRTCANVKTRGNASKV